MTDYTPATVFRDYVTPGVPSSGIWQPRKADIRNLLGSRMTSVVEAGLDPNAGDNTAAMIAIAAAGGDWYAPAQTFVFSGSTTIPCGPPLRILGANSSEYGSPQTQFRFTGANNANRFQLGDGVTQAYGHQFDNLTITAPNATGGSIFFANFASQFRLESLRMVDIGATAYGIKAWKTNSSIIDDVRIELPVSAGLYAYGDTGERSDIIDLHRFWVSGNATGAANRLPNAIEINGYANTITGRLIVAIMCGRGLFRHNAIGSTDRGEFDYFENFQVDFPQYEALRYESGTDARFLNSYFHGSQTEHGIALIENINGASLPMCRFKFIGSKISGHWKNGAYVGTDQVQFINCDIDHNSIASANTWSGIGLAPNASNVVIAGNTIRATDNAETHAYGVRIDGGSPAPTSYIIDESNILEGMSAPLADFVGDSVGRGLRGWATKSAWSAGAIGNGAQASTTLTVNNAIVGDRCEARSSIALGGLRLWADITAANTATIYLSNSTGGSLTPASMNVEVTAFIR